MARAGAVTLPASLQGPRGRLIVVVIAPDFSIRRSGVALRNAAELCLPSGWSGHSSATAALYIEPALHELSAHYAIFSSCAAATALPKFNHKPRGRYDFVD
jgi:hypothetical protein